MGGYWGVIGLPGCTMDNVIESDGMYIFPTFVSISNDGSLMLVNQQRITFVLLEKSNHVIYHHVRCLPSVTSLPCRSPAIEGSPQRKTSTVESAYGHQGIRIRLLLPEPTTVPYRTRRASRIAHSPRHRPAWADRGKNGVRLGEQRGALLPPLH